MEKTVLPCKIIYDQAALDVIMVFMRPVMQAWPPGKKIYDAAD